MDITNIKGVGEKTKKTLNSLGLYSIEDIIEYYPREYEFIGETKSLNEVSEGEMTSFLGEVAMIYPYKKFAKGKGLARITFKNKDEYLTGVWFNQPYICKAFKKGEKVFLFGKINKKMGQVQINDPTYKKQDSVPESTIYPIYSLNKNINQTSIRKITKNSLEFIKDVSREILPKSILKKYNLLDLNESLLNIHYPKSKEMLIKSEKRLKFNELFILNLGMLLAKKDFSKKELGRAVRVSKDLIKLKESLPFTLTNAQSIAVREILNDMRKDVPMNRLVQGDVGSGKTIVAIIALFNCVKMGFQGSMMAPTEILSKQHFESIKSILDKFEIKTEIITGSTTKKNKQIILEKVKNGEIDILIGTHALIEDDVKFKNLALVITDEQHRFGVRQRSKLVNKGKNPHVLVMTATPIPRTLAIFMYGDMDISIINELPKGRQEVKTYHINENKRESCYNFIKKELDSGRQCYVVCPLVEESDKLELISAEENYEKLKNYYFENYSVGLLHGKMRPNEKNDIMEKFKNKEIDILVSTTVIEVGVNVPNASVMLIENAERFGLAQLHQLRGRVGRGEYKSHCILMSESEGLESKKRMEIMTKSSNGFYIAEKDMELRGFGEFFGTRQHGTIQLKLADPFRDIEILKTTAMISRDIVESGKILSYEYEKILNIVNEKYLNTTDASTLN